MSKDITIVITTFRSNDVIFKCLNSIDKDYPVIVIENSKDDVFKKELEAKYNNVRCFLTGSNIGYGRANNYGISKVKTAYVLILNPDTQLHSDTLENFNISIKKINNFAILAPINQNSSPKEDEKIEIKEKEEDSLKYTNIEKSVKDVRGFAMLLNLKEFRDIGFFDDNFFIYYEEIDLCKRVIQKDKKIYLLPKVKISHSGGQSHDSSINYEMELSRNWHWMWSSFYYHKKHYGYFSAFIKISKKILSSFIKSIFFLMILNISKSKIYFYRMNGIFNAMIGKESWYRPKV